MKKGILKIISAVVAVCAALPCALSPVFANSGQRYEYGVSNMGVITPNKNSVLAVESEKLTFNIPAFPDFNDLSGYQSTVTAEYNFVNTSDSAVTTAMAFPIEINSLNQNDVRAPEINVNGEAVEVQTRHTLGIYEDFATNVKDILDDYYTDDFYSPETEVTKYSVVIDVGNSSGYRLTGDVKCGDGARFITWLGTENSVTKYLDSGTNELEVYVIGDAADFSCTWSFEKFKKHLFTSGEYVSTDRTFPVSETVEATTLKDFLLSYRQENSVVSDMDWYNALVLSIGINKFTSESWISNYSDSSFLTWYTYEVQVEPYGRFTNTVTAPLLSSRDYAYSPAVYNYEYYLSPAASWQSFGELEVVINTGYYLTSSSQIFNETASGYAARFDGLPNGELKFSLCTVHDPSYKRVGVAFTWLVFAVLIIFALILVGAVITAIVYLAKSSKKK